MPPEMSLTDEEVYETYLEYLPYYLEDGKPLRLMLGNLFACDGLKSYRVPGYHNLCEANAENYCICGHARNHMYIAADGRILPCMPLSGAEEIAAKFPLITEVELKDALNDSWYMSCIDTKLKDFLEINTECGSCEHRLKCASGCRGSALNYESQNYYATDRAACLLFKNDYIGRLEKIMEQGNMSRIL
jgi:radical SAM protein with 4Fe4S-binding SPASM domain